MDTNNNSNNNNDDDGNSAHSLIHNSIQNGDLEYTTDNSIPDKMTKIRHRKQSSTKLSRAHSTPDSTLLTVDLSLSVQSIREQAYKVYII